MLGRRIGGDRVTELLQTTFYRFAESRIVIDDMHQRPINFHLHCARPPGTRPRECVGRSDMTLSGLSSPSTKFIGATRNNDVVSEGPSVFRPGVPRANAVTSRRMLAQMT